MYYTTVYSSPVGLLTLASDGENLTGLWIEGQKHHGNTIFEDMIEDNKLPIFSATKKWLDQYFAGKQPAVSELSLAPEGSDFQKSVWHILCKIPYGKVITYGDIAKEIARKKGKERMSPQAVGGAVGHNPISIVIPCHRVVGSNGSLTGYAAGVDTKRKLLEWEKA
ncbi:MAG: methylated-DNA--[protein]-cysteine S-methyltransferase [Anaerostipes sp.]|nr:methylated-DNA--[protein]-cysteine S-methyltransferase [Anaerostipes sp.]